MSKVPPQATSFNWVKTIDVPVSCKSISNKVSPSNVNEQLVKVATCASIELIVELTVTVHASPVIIVRGSESNARQIVSSPASLNDCKPIEFGVVQTVSANVDEGQMAQVASASGEVTPEHESAMFPLEKKQLPSTAQIEKLFAFEAKRNTPVNLGLLFTKLYAGVRQCNWHTATVCTWVTHNNLCANNHQINIVSNENDNNNALCNCRQSRHIQRRQSGVVAHDAAQNSAQSVHSTSLPLSATALLTMNCPTNRQINIILNNKKAQTHDPVDIKADTSNDVNAPLSATKLHNIQRNQCTQHTFTLINTLALLTKNCPSTNRQINIISNNKTHSTTHDPVDVKAGTCNDVSLALFCTRLHNIQRNQCTQHRCHSHQ